MTEDRKHLHMTKIKKKKEDAADAFTAVLSAKSAAELKEKRTRAELERLEEEMRINAEKINSYSVNLKQLQADFENYRKRQEKLQKDAEMKSSRKLVEKLLVLLDDIEIAEKSIHGADPKILQGFKLIRAKLWEILRSEGVTEISTSGKFDSNLHEAEEHIESDKPDGSIVSIVRKGYLLNERVLRTAIVNVSKEKHNEQESAKSR